MPVFEMVNGWSITIYLNDHLPIHFHGKLSPADRNRLQKFAKENREQIEEYWNELH